MKTLSKISFILLISISLFGCGSNIPMDKKTELPYIV